MYSNYSLYYLQQLGIIPWVSRNVVKVETEKKLKLLICVACSLTQSAQIFVKQILIFLNLNDNECSLVSLNEIEDEYLLNQLYEQPIVLIFGSETAAILRNKIEITNESKATKKNFEQNFIVSLDLTSLLNKPYQKKELLKQLMLIQILLKKCLN